MTIEERVAESLDAAWVRLSTRSEEIPSLPHDIALAADTILDFDSAPNRQVLLTIAAATVVDPSSNPASLQLPAGVDRRGQAYRVRDALTMFRNAHSFTLKISSDPGVSNQWREPEINAAWVKGRKKQNRAWAQAFHDIVAWLSESPDPAVRKQYASELLDKVALRIVDLAASNSLNYPMFPATPSLALSLVKKFLDTTEERPDALEAIVAAAVRQLGLLINPNAKILRRDINSPDPIDVIIEDKNGALLAGVEVTDNWITLSKLEHEVLPAMLSLGLERATVVSRGTQEGKRKEIESFVRRTFQHLGLYISLETIDSIETWLSFPGSPKDLSKDFIQAIGRELDEHSSTTSRKIWLDTLLSHISSMNFSSPTNIPVETDD